MNQKKTVVIASGVVAVALLTGCSTSDKYEYSVSGKVHSQQVDYDCPGENLSMEPVGFGEKGGATGGGSSSSSSGGSRSSSNRSSNNDGGGSGGSGGGSNDSNSGSNKVSKPSKSNKGVKLDKKPDSPQKVKKAKKSFDVKPKGCENEYEIFVLDKKGNLYEQDVRKTDYDKCLSAKVPSGEKAKLFPLCTKG
jgi:hypothetical protein